MTVGAASCTASGAGNIHDTVKVPASAGVVYHLMAIVQASPEITITNTATVATAAPEPHFNLSNNTAISVDVVRIYKDRFE